jgi:hypothetical protein
MFNSDATFEMKVRGPEGMKTVVLRFPSDVEQGERVRKQKMITKDLGRGSSESDYEPNHAYDLALINELMQEPKVEVDEYEATYLLNKLCKSDAQEAVRVDITYQVPVKTCAGTVTITLAVPSQRDIREYSRTSLRTVNRSHGLQESKVNLESSGLLFDKVVRGTDNITGPVPLVFKASAVQELLSVMRDEEEADRDQDF